MNIITEIFNGIHKLGRIILSGVTVWLVKDMVIALHSAGVPVDTISILTGLVVAVPTAYVVRKGVGFTHKDTNPVTEKDFE